jgi:hypothetical protein
MGDIANGYHCDVFIFTFADALIAKYRSPLLDATFGDLVRYYVQADLNWEVGLYAALKTTRVSTGEPDEEHFRLEGMPLFAPTADDIIAVIAEGLDISEEEAERRLKEKAAEMEREEKEYRARAEREVEEELEGEEDEEP